MIAFTMTKQGNYAVYERGQYSGFMVYRNGGDIFPTSVYYGGQKLYTADDLEDAKAFVRKALGQ